MWTGEAYLRGLRYAHQGKQDEGQEGGDGQGQSFSAPEECHENDGIGTVGFLWVGGKQQSCWRGQVYIPESCHLLPPEKIGLSYQSGESL